MAFITSALTMATVVAAVTMVPKLLGRKTKSANVKINENGEKSIDVTPIFFWTVYGIAS